MTTINIIGNDPVDISATTPTPTLSTPTLANYVDWTETGRLDWTDTQENDVITVTCSVFTSVTSIVSASTDELEVKARIRLYDETQGAEAWSGTYSQTILHTFGAITCGNEESCTSLNITYYAGAPGLLQVGRDYSVRVELRKEQVVGTPTGAVAVRDISMSADSARVL